MLSTFTPHPFRARQYNIYYQGAKFILEADKKLLCIKVILIFSMFGACQTDDLLFGSILTEMAKITIQEISQIQRKCPFGSYSFFSKYSNLRPKNMNFITVNIMLYMLVAIQ